MCWTLYFWSNLGVWSRWDLDEILHLEVILYCEETFGETGMELRDFVQEVDRYHWRSESRLREAVCALTPKIPGACASATLHGKELMLQMK